MEKKMQEIKLLRKFGEKFGIATDAKLYFAPGRVNLIGEYTDYNGGYVLPCGLSIGTYAVASRRTDQKIKLYSMNCESEEVIEIELSNIKNFFKKLWTSYPLGVMKNMIDHGYEIPSGINMLVYGDLPIGAGVGSSASLEILSALVVKDLYWLDDLTMKEMALICQEAEHRYIGKKCGIMDQFTVARSRRNYAMLLNTKNLSFKRIPLILEDSKIVIINTCVNHSKKKEAYNHRRNECEKALEDLQKVINVHQLCDLSVTDFEEYKKYIQNDTVRKRAEHVVYENMRTLAAAKALEEGDLIKLGMLMKASHCSLKNKFEVSCKELDFLTEMAWEYDGVIGARMTGGGFGGSTVNIVKTEKLEAFIVTLKQAYFKEFGIDFQFFMAEVSDGAYVRLSQIDLAEKLEEKKHFRKN